MELRRKNVLTMGWITINSKRFMLKTLHADFYSDEEPVGCDMPDYYGHSLDSVIAAFHAREYQAVV